MLSEAFLGQLRTLSLASRRRHRGSTIGERRSVKRGRSVEFADYRNYTPGDDPRRVDWNVYARLERPVIKLYEDEEDLAVHLFLDQSASMYWQPDDAHGPGKLERAADLAIALGYITLASCDKVTLHASASGQFGPRRGIATFAELVRFVELAKQAKPNARLSLNSWLRASAQRAKPGLGVLLSDLFDEQGYAEGINALGAAGIDINVLHTLSPEELDPSLTGDVQLKDIETSGLQDLSVDDIVLGQYRQRLSEFTAAAAAQCRKTGGLYALIDVSLPVEHVVLRDLRAGGWLF
jgi:uncharacterized protein (DUF58 family)